MVLSVSPLYIVTIFDSIVKIIIDEFNFLSNAKSKMYSYLEKWSL